MLPILLNHKAGALQPRFGVEYLRQMARADGLDAQVIATPIEIPKSLEEFARKAHLTPILRDGLLCGIIARADLIRLLAENATHVQNATHVPQPSATKAQ